MWRSRSRLGEIQLVMPKHWLGQVNSNFAEKLPLTLIDGHRVTDFDYEQFPFELHAKTC